MPVIEECEAGVEYGPIEVLLAWRMGMEGW